MDRRDSSFVLDHTLPPFTPATLPPPRPLLQLALRIGSFQLGVIADFRCFGLVVYRGKRRVLQIECGELG